MTRRIHHMPFGAELQANGAVRFRLWAPSAKSVALVLTAPQRKVSMPAAAGQEFPLQRLEGGWFELATDAATAGSLYQFRIDEGLAVPDPASRSNPQDVHGPSCVVDPEAFEWRDADWHGRPWHQAVVYELHVGTFTREGTFAGIERRLDHLTQLGVTVIELMPIAEFPGRRNWGYDGVLPFAPDAAYGPPEDLKRLVSAAHARGLMVMLDVVYNHFGPDGNYLHAYAKPFFTDRYQTPWGQAIDFEGPHSRVVRDFFIHNALYWLEEFHLDGLRFDAVHAVIDHSPLDLFTEISRRVRDTLGRGRQIHLVLENHWNESRRLGPAPAAPGRFEAQWNDDVHHCLHVLLTGERDGYYADFAQDTLRLLGRCLAEGFAYQGEFSPYHSGREARGEPSTHLPPTAFVGFLQNHDQIGNRAYGDRLVEITDPRALRAAIAVLLLSPQPPMLFMGEEWGAPERFPFFCDFGPELSRAVRAGRLREFERFEKFRSAEARACIPDPCDPETHRGATLDWNRLNYPVHAQWLGYYKELLEIRHREIIPRLPGARSGHFATTQQGLLTVRWPLKNGATLTLMANLTSQPQTAAEIPGRVLFSTPALAAETRPATDSALPSMSPVPAALALSVLQPWSVACILGPPL